jgi:hypothetical protein
MWDETQERAGVLKEAGVALTTDLNRVLLRLSREPASRFRD